MGTILILQSRSPMPAPITSIQDAVDAATPGGTIYIPPGTYAETVTISKALTIVGQDATITGSGVRERWVTVQHDDVTLNSLNFIDAAAGAVQTASIDVNGYTGFRMENCTAVGGSYAALRLWPGAHNAVILNCDISYAPGLGILCFQADGGTLQGTRSHHHLGSGGAGWEAGGIKIVECDSWTIYDNELDHNTGPGVWFDGKCSGHSVTQNIVHHNSENGIMDETSTSTVTRPIIAYNKIWECGWGNTAGNWGWPAGVLVSTSNGTYVHHNYIAWCPVGYSFIEQDRADFLQGDGYYVRDLDSAYNFIAMDDRSWTGDRQGGCWLTDHPTPVIYGGTNVGLSDQFYWEMTPPTWARYGWWPVGTHIDTVSVYGTLAGGGLATEVSAATKNAVLGAVGIPTSPEA